ncbi:alkaline phosphatase PhoX [Patulibacter americanus]|uniref:alkaline phosphatase PhoX n=1 Tax=Patulibacter americanus TaxID=588672 RepID=UPI0003B557D3|nr:alkaline phosphatase PhoX [Patulibacter americanus]
MTSTSRRTFVSSSLAAAGLLTFGPAFWRGAMAAPAKLGAGPYGELLPANEHGLMLPPGFASREIARGGQPVQNTAYAWHRATDGMATYATQDGGWIVVSNSETNPGGVSSIRFTKDGEIADAYRILGAPSRSNCGGGPTPWGTWLTGEEYDGGLIWECDPTGRQPAVARPALGVFSHEAAAVDLERRHVYLTEDKRDGCFYRFTAAKTLGDGGLDLTSGVLEVATGVGQEGVVVWKPVPDPSAASGLLRSQVADARRYNGSEGVWFDDGAVIWTSKGDNSLWSYDVETAVVERLYDPATSGNGTFLKGPDNICVSRSGDLFVCEDNSDLDFDVVLLSYGERTVSPFLRAVGDAANGSTIHNGSELAGVCFSPDGERMFVGSQRAHGGAGAVYEITGPFRHAPVPADGSGETPAPVPPRQPVAVLPVVPSAPRPPAAVEDTDAPGLKIKVARDVDVRTFLEEGILVSVTTDEPTSLTVTVTTGELGYARERERPTRVRPRADTLGTRRLAPRRSGVRNVHPKLRSTQAERLQRALRAAARGKGKTRVRARVTVTARDRSSNVTVATRTLWITPAKRSASRAS